ncbi:AAA family ATPase [Actinosynnema sp. CS-041913]|uniref:AAA family ATPase n=1 Tax=Actinosynnema sp. CS-041913 TaxID=3239917 RepID=UPI003D8D868E
MLIRFEVANFRSILDPVELSMVAVDRDRPEARPVPNLNESLLSVAAIYGPNASGKSNVLAALNWLTAAVEHSLRLWDERIPTEPSAFASGSDLLTEFTVESVISDVRYEYVVELDQQRVHYEGLFHYPEKKRRRIFERDGEDLKLQRGLGNVSGTRELLTPRTLALSIAQRFDEPLISDFYRDLALTQAFGLMRRGRTAAHRPTCEWFDDPEDRSRSTAMLRMADLGIDDVMIESEHSRIRLVHRTANDERVPFGLDDESAGTQTWYHLIGPVLTALRHGSLLLFDELDASLHPTLSAQLIRLFQDPVTNPQGAQLIFTSHDTSLLNHLNRDEVWLTEKTEKGTTRLGALAEFAGERVRKSQNLENAYLHGRFGALPDVNRTEVLRTLRLIG